MRGMGLEFANNYTVCLIEMFAWFTLLVSISGFGAKGHDNMFLGV